MKSMRLMWIIVLLLNVLPTFIFGQASTKETYSSYEARKQGYMTFGIDGGLSYQSSDVCANFKGWGAGLTLAKNLYYRENAALAFDIRGRALFTRSFGSDTQRSNSILGNNALNGSNRSIPSLDYLTTSNFVYANHRTDMAELGLEGVFTLNRLRERTNWVVSLFGGIGLDWYKVKLDQRNGSGIYATDYLAINQNESAANIKSSLLNIRDGNYETLGDGFNNTFGKLRFMPDLGLEVGYHFTPRFYAGIGHKLTFSRTDILDGQRYTRAAGNTLTNDNDLSHYTSVHFRWIIEEDEKKDHAPVVDITQPRPSPYTTTASSINVYANIKHVNSAMDVTFTLNGDNAPFNFSNEKLASTVRLNKGKNIVSIRARNSVGSDEESVIIYLNTPDGSFPPPPPPQPVPTPTTYPPVISWVRPSNNPETTTFSTFEVKARINNVERKKDVRFYINGYESNDFDFNPNSGDFKANARLRDGDNNLTLSAINKGGNDQKETRIILQVPTPERVDVAITQPQSNPYQTQQNSITIEANIRGVNDKRDLEVRINGKGLSNFNFDKSRGKLTASVSLDKGENHVIVKANGRSSSDSDERVINYQTNVQPPPPPPPAENNKPKVTILQPNSGDVANQKSTLVRATVTNVNNKNDITLTVNNVKVFNYEYSTKDHLLIATVDLNDGNNTISVRAQNSYGSDEESVNVKVLAKINIPKAPKVKISAPINGINLTNANTIVKASVSNVTDKSKISFKLNNNDINDFAFSNGEIQASITLREGSNNINIKATNADGSDDDAVVVNYTKQVAAPTVTITSPNDNVKAKTNSIKVTANVKNAVQRDVSCFVNGKVITGFTMVAEQVAFDATLVPGKNIILVKVQNVSGKAEDQVNVMFAEIPNATKPTVQFIDPAEIGKTVSSNVYKVKAKVTGVTSNNEITIKLNNNKISNFNFNERNGEVTFDANLNIGKNVISIDVKTKGGVDVANTTINYENKGLPTLAKPEIVTLTATQPVGNPMNPTAPAVSTVTATLKNISDKKEISLSVNGKKTDEFTFANRSGILTANVQLRSGENIIKLTVTNNAGSATKTTTINY